MTKCSSGDGTKSLRLLLERLRLLRKLLELLTLLVVHKAASVPTLLVVHDVLLADGRESRLIGTPAESQRLEMGLMPDNAS